MSDTGRRLEEMAMSGDIFGLFVQFIGFGTDVLFVSLGKFYNFCCEWWKASFLQGSLEDAGRTGNDVVDLFPLEG